MSDNAWLDAYPAVDAAPTGLAWLNDYPAVKDVPDTRDARDIRAGVTARAEPEQEPEPEQPSGVIGIGKALYGGAKNLIEMGRATGNVVSGDNTAIEQGAERSKANDAQSPLEKRQFMADYMTRNRADAANDGEVGFLDAVGNLAASAWNNKMGFTQAIAEQAPNAVPVLGLGLAGAAAGAASPVPGGTIIGGFLGMALGNAGIEIGSKAIQKAEGGLTDAESSEALREGSIKGTVIAGVDLATLGIGGKAMKAIGGAAVKAGAQAEAKVLIDAGVDMASREAIGKALLDPTLKASATAAGNAAAKATLTTAQKAGMAATGLSLETVGEGAGDYLGEVAATGKGDMADAVLESLMGGAQSSIETAYNYSKAGRNNLDVGNIASAAKVLATPNTPDGLDQSLAAAGAAVNPAAQVFPDIADTASLLDDSTVPPNDGAPPPGGGRAYPKTDNEGNPYRDFVSGDLVDDGERIDPFNPDRLYPPVQQQTTGAPNDGSTGLINTAIAAQGSPSESPVVAGSANNVGLDGDTERLGMGGIPAESGSGAGSPVVVSADQPQNVNQLQGAIDGVTPDQAEQGKPEAQAETPASAVAPVDGRVTPDIAANFKQGQVIKDADGNLYQAHAARHGWLEAHPIVDGKPVVNKDSSVIFHLSPDTQSAYPERNHSPVFAVAPPTPATPLPESGAPSAVIQSAAQPDVSPTPQEVTRNKKGHAEIIGFSKADVADAIKPLRIRDAVINEQDGKIVVTGKSGMSLRIKDTNAIKNTLVGKDIKPPVATRLTGNIINDLRHLGYDGLYQALRDNKGDAARGFRIDEAADELNEIGYSDITSPESLTNFIRAGRKLSDRAEEQAMEDNYYKGRRDAANKGAHENGLKGIGGKRTLEIVEAELEKVKAEREELNRQARIAAELLDEVAEQELIEHFNLQVQEYLDETAIARTESSAESAQLSAEIATQEDSDQLDQNAPVAGGEGFTLEANQQPVAGILKRGDLAEGGAEFGQWELDNVEKRTKRVEYIDNQGEAKTKLVADMDNAEISHGSGMSIANIFWLKRKGTGEVKPFGSETAPQAMGISPERAAKRFDEALSKSQNEWLKTELAKYGASPTNDPFGNLHRNPITGKQTPTNIVNLREWLLRGSLSREQVAKRLSNYYAQPAQERPSLDLAPESNEEIAARLEREAEAKRQRAAEDAKAARDERNAKDKAEKDRRAAEIIAEDKARRDAEVAALQNPDDFVFGANAPKAPDPVIKKVSTEQARGQGDVFAQGNDSPKSLTSEPAKENNAAPSSPLEAFADAQLKAAQALKDAVAQQGEKPAESPRSGTPLTQAENDANSVAADAAEFAMQIENDARDTDDFDPSEIPAALRYRADDGQSKNLDLNALRTALIAELKKRKPFPFRTDVIKILEKDGKAEAAVFDVDADGGHSWSAIKAHSEWVKLAKNQWHYRFEGMGNGVVIDTHAEEGRSGENRWRTSDGELHVKLSDAKAHEIETYTKPKLIDNGYLNESAKPKDDGPKSADDYEKFIKVAADSIKDLRKVDVYRVLVESNRKELRQGIAGYIKANRPDLVAEVDSVMTEAAAAESPPVGADDTPVNPDQAAINQADDDFKDALGDLGDILGKNFRANLTPEQEQKLLPVLTRLFDAAFRKGYYKFKQAARFVLDAIRKNLGEDVANEITLDHLQGAYIGMAGKYKDQGADKARDVVAVESKEEIDNESDERSSTDLERDSQDAEAADGVGAQGVSAGRGGNERPGEQGIQDAETESGSRRSGSVSGREAIADGERSDQSVYTGDTERATEDGAAGSGIDSGSDTSGIDGSPIEPERTDLFEDDATSRIQQEVATLKQRQADKLDHKPGLENIRATLPALLEGQQEDVHTAETRFAKPDGYGMLFTNGTGTGKTFLGLGIIKRMVLNGKNNIIITAPNDKIASDWQKSGKVLGLDIAMLADTKSAGSGVVVTTYSNFGQNNELAQRNWDLIVHDEAHYLSLNSKGEQTLALQSLRALSLHPDGAFARSRMLHPELYAKASELQALAKSQRTSDDQNQWYDSQQTEAKLKAVWEEIRAKETAVKEDVAAHQGAARPRVLFLSATPFAYEKTVDWANGYLFDYNEGRGDERNESRGYNAGSNSDQFMMQHFGYRMRYGKLTAPDAKVDTGLMQRQFNSWLKKQGVLAGRMLDVSADYDRRFILTESAIGSRIDEALQWFEEQRKAKTFDKNTLNDVSDIIAKKFDYLSRRYLLEAIKAKEVIPHIKEHLALGRKVVVFHDYKKGGGFNPFDLQDMQRGEAFTSSGDVAGINEVIHAFRAEFKDLINSDVWRASSPIDAITKAFPDALLFNGDVSKNQRRANVEKFQSDASGPQVILVQSAAGREGISLHDTTGKHQRVLLNLGQPTAPTTAIQQEGRIYRTGQVTDAIFRYLNTGTNWEKWAFATAIAQRASAAENLGMGEQARALKDAFIAGFEESDDYRAGMEGEGKGGKERDKAANNALTEYDRAKAFYFGTQKKNSRTKAQEGTDYFATPEPVGLKMMELADIRPGESVLEPSAGHGAIARWMPDSAEKTAIEPSTVLRSRLAMVFDGKMLGENFEDLNVVNKYDAIVMNPPFGVGGKTAIEHLAKAATHLRDGGRIVALIPRGPAADKRFDKWMYETDDKAIKPIVNHPTLGPIYKGDTIETKESWAPEGTVNGMMDGELVLKAISPEFRGATTRLDLDGVKSIKPTGKRTESFSPSKGFHLVADIALPNVTFERAGTQVATRIVVIEKSENSPSQTNRDYSNVDDINDLFDRMESLSIDPRAKPVEAEPEAAPAQSSKPAKAGKPAPAEIGTNVTIGGVDYPMSIYITNDGKEKHGIWMPEKEARAINPRAFKSAKNNGTPNQGKYFVDEYWLNKRKPDSSILESRKKWYRSQLESAIDQVPAKIDNGPGNQWALWLQSNAGKLQVKADELKWSGVLDYLQMQGKNKVSKEQVQDFLLNNNVQVKDVVLGETDPASDARRDELLAQYRDNIDKVADSRQDVEEGKKTSEQHLADAKAWGIERDKLDEEINAINARRTDTRHANGDLVLPGGTEQVEIVLTVPGIKPYAESDRTHYGDIGGGTAVAWIRGNTRIDADGSRVFFIEELQSKRAQMGKKEGFVPPNFEQRIKELHDLGADATREQRLELHELQGKAFHKVPVAPFVTDTKAWTSLALKRAIAYAVDNGFDKVAWTTGEQQAARYDLSKQINSAHAIANGDGTYNLTIEGKNGDEIAPYARSGKKVTPSEMEDVIGKDVSKKLIEGADRNKGKPWPKGVKNNPEFFTMSDLDLKVGGEGMKGYYDAIVPQVAKKLGAEVGEVTVPIGKLNGSLDWYARYTGPTPTSADIAKVREATEAYGRDNYINPLTGEKMNQIVNRVTNSQAVRAVQQSMYAGATFAEAMQTDGNGSIAEIFGGKLEQVKVDTAPTAQPGFTITDAMREQVAKGLPLFAKSEESQEFRNGIVTGHTVADIRAGLVKSFGKTLIANLESKGLLRIVADADELSRQGHEISDTGTALWNGKTAYLVADRMTPDNALRELLHEIGEHAGLERMLGEKGYANLKRRVALMNKAGNKRVQGAYAFVNQNYDYAEGSDNFFHEVLANLGQDADIRAKSWWKEMIATIKRWAVQFLGEKWDKVIPLKTGDIEDMVLRSLKAAGKSDQFAGAGNMVPAMASNRKSTDITTIDRLSRNIETGIGGRPVYLRFTRDAEGDARGRRSANWVNKERESGLSVVALSDDGLGVYIAADDNLPGSDPVNIGGAISNYIDYFDFRGATDAQLVTGEIAGVGSDGEPLLKNVQNIGSVDPEVLFDAYQAWAEAQKDPALLGLVSNKISRLRAIMESKAASPAPTQSVDTESANFRRWAKTDNIQEYPSDNINHYEEGQAIVVKAFHGAGGDRKISEFMPLWKQHLSMPWMAIAPGGRDYDYHMKAKAIPEAHFFARNEDVAVSYADQYESGQVIPVFIRLENPAVDSSRDVAMDRMESDPSYDGAIFNDTDSAGHFAGVAYVVRRSIQIKHATENNGNFSLTNPSILESRQAALPNTAAAQPPAPPTRQTPMGLQGGQSGNNATWQQMPDTKLDAVIEALQDKHITTKRVVQAIKDAGRAIADKWDVYLQETLFHGRAAKATLEFVETELTPIAKELQMRGLTMDELDEYLWARHAEEANALIADRNPGMPDGGSGMTNKEAQDYFKNTDAGKLKRLEAVAKQVDAMIAKTRNLYASYGLESQETVDGWANMFKHYVPLMRDDKDGAMGIGQGFSIKGKEVKSRTGSTREVVDILANIAMQREKVILRGEKNRVSVALMGLAKLNPNPDFWTFDKVPHEQVFNPKTGLVEDRPDPMFKSRDNVIVAKIPDGKGGVQERAVVFNENNDQAVRMAAALKNLDAAQIEGLLGHTAKITRYFASINTQYNPVFGVTNLVRDIQAAMLGLGTTPIAGHKADVMKHLLGALRGIYIDSRQMRKGQPATSAYAQEWEEFQHEGGQTGYRDMFRTSADRAKAIEHAIDPHKWMDSGLGKIFTAGGMLKVPMAVAQDKAGWLFDLLSDYNEAMENSVRLAAYKVGKQQGMSKQRAAEMAKGLTVNFNRKGQVGLQAGSLYAFFNASVQGTGRIVETLFDIKGNDIKTLRLSKLGQNIVAGGILWGTMQALMLAAAGFDDEDPPEFVKQRASIIPIGDKKYLTIPMPLGFNILPNIGRISTEFVLGGFKSPGKHIISLMGLMADSFNPVGGNGTILQMVSPTALDPMVAIAENKDWTKKPIAKESMNKTTPGFTLWKDTASAPSKWIAEAINTMSGGTKHVRGALSPTPDQIDYLFGQVTGGVGRELSKTQQTISATVTGEDLPPHKTPLIGRFYGNADGQSSQATTFYGNINRINEYEAEVKGLRKEGKGAEASQFIVDNPEARLVARANYSERVVQKLRKEKHDLIDKDAPRERIKALEDRIKAEMVRLNNAVRNAKSPQQRAA